MTPTSRPAHGAGTRVLHDAQHTGETLLAHHILRPEHAAAAVDALTAPASPPTSQAAQPPRGRLAEVAGYAGGALVASAAGLFLTTSFSSLSMPGRAGLLAGAALVLAVVGA